MTTDTTADTAADDGRWLSYPELAALRRISVGSAKRLVLRHRWRRQSDNRGIVRVFVPADVVAESASKAIHTADAAEHVTADVVSDVPRVMAALEATITALTVRAERAEAEADRAVSAHASAVAAADREGVRADEVTARLEAANVDLATIRGERDAAVREVQIVRERANRERARVEEVIADKVRLQAEIERMDEQVRRSQVRWWRRLLGRT